MCRVIWDEDPYILDGEKKIPFSQVHIGMALDPAFTYKGITNKTSRTAIVVAAKDHEDNVYILDVRAGFFRVSKTMDLIFELVEKYEGHLIGLLFESNAQQKMLEDIFKEERSRRGLHIALLPKAAKEDKDARIRSTIGNYLTRGRLHVVKGQSIDFIDELKSFPMAKYKKDVLDASEKVIGYLNKPPKPEEVLEAEVEYLEQTYNNTVNCTGY